MIGFIVRRTLSMLVTFIVVSIVIFLMMHSIPGGPFDGYEMPLPDNIRPSLVFTGPMGRPRVVVNRSPIGNYLASVPMGLKYDVAVENLPDGYVVKSIVGEAIPFMSGTLNARPLMITIGRK